MRINKFIAQSTGLSRRKADEVIESGNVTINGKQAALGSEVGPRDKVTLNGQPVSGQNQTTTIILNKPVGYICSRDGQGAQTIYDLLPKKYHHLKPVGRLDKDSSGLLLLTNDGDLAHKLTHPKFHKIKVYEIKLNKSLDPADREKITQTGVRLKDGISKFELNWMEKDNKGKVTKWMATLYEGRNRQIRRTFVEVGYQVATLNRIKFGPYNISEINTGDFQQV